MSTDQSAVIEFLNKPETYGLEGGEGIQRFDTHISIVFLAGEFAYKLKRAIELSFLDFREIEDRKKYCELEFKINQRTSAKLYEGVIPVTLQPDGKLCLNGTGEIVDWLVKMKRFNQENLFESLAEKNLLNPQNMENFTDHIVDHYRQADIDKSHGGTQGIIRAFKGHFKAFEKCPDHVLVPKLESKLQETVNAEIQRNDGLLQDRQAAGFVRHCHGDLHLRNICMFEDEITLFDAIEFEDDYAIIDVFYDLSFLLMDLCHRGFVDLANAVMNRYLGLTGDVSALNLLPLFMASRSAIRTHVNATASVNQQNSVARVNFEEDARSYLKEAIAYLDIAKPKLVALGGLSGTGKSVLAKKIAPKLGRKPGAFIVRTDLIRKRLMGVKPEEKIGEEGYLPDVTAHTYNTLFIEVRLALHAGQSVIVDGVFARPQERSLLGAIAKEFDVPFFGIWLEADQETLKNRVESRKNDPSDADAEIVNLQADYDLGVISWTRLNTGQDIENIYDNACKIVGLV